MSLVRGLIKSAIVVKMAQVAQRELSKPENQQKIKEGFEKVKESRQQAPLEPDEPTLDRGSIRRVAAPPGVESRFLRGVSLRPQHHHRELTPHVG